MKFGTLLITVGFSFACIAVLSEEDKEPDAKPIQDTTDVVEDKPAPLPTKVRMLCEYACPPNAYLTMPTDVVEPDDVQTDTTQPDATISRDVINDGVTSKDTCGDVYEFSVCCGDDVCQNQESSFFCPGDCL